MSVGIRPEEPEQLACDICLVQVPADGANNAEHDDYVLHFFGAECYRRWRARNAPGQTDDHAWKAGSGTKFR